MEDYLEQIERAVQANLYYLAFGAVLTIPDICAALGAENGETTGARYQAWYDQEFGDAYEGYLSARDCYLLRCKFLHQGRARHEGEVHQRLVFLEPSSNQTITAHKCIMNDVLVLDVPTFCQDMVNTARRWLAANGENETVQANLAKSIKRHPGGLAPYFKGVPVIG